MNDISLSNEKNSSINLSRTSKGAYSWDIKLYYDPEETHPEVIIEKIKSINEKLKSEFKELV